MLNIKNIEEEEKCVWDTGPSGLVLVVARSVRFNPRVLALPLLAEISQVMAFSHAEIVNLRNSDCLVL